MRLEFWGPLIFWTLMFIVASAIKLIAFEDSGFWLQLGQELSLWSTGVLFTLAASESSYERARTVRTVSRNLEERSTTVSWTIEPPEDLGFNPRFLYLFLLGVVVWILTILLAGIATRAFQTSNVLGASTAFSYGFSLILGFLMVGLTVGTLVEVNR